MFEEISRKNNLAKGDFPHPDKFSKILKQFDIWKFPVLKKKELAIIDDVLTNKVPKLLSTVQFTEEVKVDEQGPGFNPFDVNEGPTAKEQEGTGLSTALLRDNTMKNFIPFNSP